MVDQERLKSYIEMGFDKDAALEICQKEDKEAQKAAAKNNNVDNDKKDPEDDKQEPNDDMDTFKKDLAEAMQETVKREVAEALKADKLSEILKGDNNNQEVNKSTSEQLTDHVKQYYNYK